MPIDTHIYKDGNRHWIKVGVIGNRAILVEYDTKLKNSIAVFSETVNLGGYKVVGTTTRNVAEMAKFRLPREIYFLCDSEKEGTVCL